MPATELLRELPLEAGSLPFTTLRPCGPRSDEPIISAGRSFHSVSERWFWNDWPFALPAVGGGGAAPDGEEDDIGGRLTISAVALGESCCCLPADEEAAVFALVGDGSEELTVAWMGRWTSQAEPGRSLR